MIENRPSGLRTRIYKTTLGLRTIAPQKDQQISDSAVQSQVPASVDSHGLYS